MKNHFHCSHHVVCTIVAAVCFVHAAGFSTSFAADTPGISPNGYEILKKALLLADEATSTVTVISDDDLELEMTESKKLSRDGQRLSRIDAVGTDGKPSLEPPFNLTSLVNAEGIWELHEEDKLALFLKYQSEEKKAIAGIDPNFNKPPIVEQNVYRVKEVQFNGVPSYKIVMTLAPDVYKNQLELRERYINEIMVKHRGEPSSNKKSSQIPPLPKAADKTASLYEFIVGKESHVIWATKEYGKDGDLIDKHEYSKVEYGLPLADDLFEVPQGYKIVTINSISEHSNLTVKIYTRRVKTWRDQKTK